MKCFLLLLFLTVGGSVTAGIFDQCDFELCQKMWTSSELEEIEFLPFPPSKEQLKIACSPVMQVFTCTDNVVKDCTGYNFEEMLDLNNRTLYKVGAFHTNGKRVLNDLCDEDTPLHKSYVKNVDCFKDIILKETAACRKEARELYGAFQGSLEVVGDEKDSIRLESEERCMITSYVIACFSETLRESCGEEARATFIEILKRLKYVTNLEICSEEDFAKLKTQFLDFLEYEKEKRDVFANAFDLKRRRK